MSPAPVTPNENTNTNASTGPRTPEGKSVSCRNALKHGLASATMIIVGESAEEWEEFRDGMFAEWLPDTPTEQALVGDMAKHQWLKDRAIRLQNDMMEFFGLEDRRLPRLTVLMRYQTTNERSFARAKQQMEEMRKNRRPIPENEFVSQYLSKAAEPSAKQPPKRRKSRSIPRTDSEINAQIDYELAELEASLGLTPAGTPAKVKAAS